METVSGEVPPDLEGTYFRNGPGKFDFSGSGERAKHPFDGDGFLVSIALKGSRAFFRSRFVETQGLQEEEAAGEILFRNTFGTQRKWARPALERALANFGDSSQKNVANTSVIWWAGKLLCLWEASQPHRVDPHDLRTLGLETLDGLLKEGLPFATGVEPLDKLLEGCPDFNGDPLSAHPHVDAATGRLCTFGYTVQPGARPGSFRTVFKFYEFPEGSFRPVGGAPREFAVDGFAFVHDFAFTERYYLLFQCPVDIDMVPFVAGTKCPGECLRFDGDKPVKVHLIPRPGPAAAGLQPRTVDMESCFVFHHANAYDDGEDIVADSIQLPYLPEFSTQSGPDGDFLSVDFAAQPYNTLWRARIRTEGVGEVESAQVVEKISEFPAVNPSVFGRRHRYVFQAIVPQYERNAPLQGLQKVDTEDPARCEEWFPGPRCFCGEPEVAPKRGGEAEDDVWVLCLFFDGASRSTQLAILDGACFAQGPVAVLRCPAEFDQHAPYGLHGNFYPDFFGPQEA